MPQRLDHPLASLLLIGTLALFTISCDKLSQPTLSGAGSQSNSLIYGTDDRFDFNVVRSGPMKSSSRAVGIILKDSYMDKVGETYQLKMNLTKACPGEKFADELRVMANCTGFMVTPTLLATAGHCVDAYPCEGAKIIFGYRNSGTGAPTEFSSRDVYSCKRVIYSSKSDYYFEDHGLIELDRPVAGIVPLSLSSNDVVPGDRVASFSYPYGLSLKYTTGSIINFEKEKEQEVNDNFYFSDMDGFGGSSGAPILNSKDGSVVGIYSFNGGNGDMVWDKTRQCNTYVTCTSVENCGGPSGFSKVKKLKALLNGL
jgi:V8-like Glu-specific endopeptidase